MDPGDISRERLNGAKEDILRLETALRRSEKLAHIGQLAAAVMHEINNPAEAVGNLIYLISQNAHDPELVISFSQQAEEQLRRVQYVARQTLSYFREQPRRQNTELVSLIKTAIRFYEPSLSNKNITLQRQMPESLVAGIFPGDFLQLVSNLLRNSIEAVPEGGVLRMRLRASSQHIRFTIADSGCGIPKKIRAHLFQPFQTSKSEAGNGLGLWICKEIAEKHGTHLAWRTSTEPETHGTTFSIAIAS